MRVAILPPILMSHHRDFDGACRAARVLHAVDYLSRRQEEHNNYHNRQHGPSQFHLFAAINLRRLGLIVFALSKFHHGISEQTEDNDEDRAEDFQFEDRQAVN